MSLRSSAIRGVPGIAVLLLILGGTAAVAQGGDAYEDVTADGVHSRAIEALQDAGVLAGTECDRDMFCPDEPILRWAAAVWLVRAIIGHDPAETTQTRFSDTGWAAHVDRLSDLGVTKGCDTDPARFCPDQAVTRSQMASFLTRAFDLPDAHATGFGDVTGYGNVSDMDSVTAARLVEACSVDPLLYCPDETVTRGQTATALARAMDLIPPARYQPLSDPTPLPADPAVRIGTLDNGLTYYLKSNDSPGDSLSLRLVVNAGSLNDPGPGLGIAHFLEHMLFKGTATFTADDLNEAVRTLGAELGPDLNAEVSYEQTVYDLTLASDPPENVNTAFDVLSQIAFQAVIPAEALPNEKGVLLDELRIQRDTSSGQIATAFDRIYTEGTPYEGYNPGGAKAAIEAIMIEDLRAFYDTWYVPSNMALVAVGDLPVGEMQDLVEDYFGSEPASDVPTFAPLVLTPDPAPAFHVVTNEGNAYSYISLDIPIPRPDPGTAGGDRLLLLEEVIRVMLSNRLEEAYYLGEISQVDRPTLATFSHSRGLRYYGTNWRGDDLAAASTGYMSVLLTAQEHGFSDAEVARATDQIVASLEQDLERAGTTSDRSYVATFTADFLGGDDIGTAADRHDRLSATLDSLTAEELSAHYRWLMERAGPLVIAVGPDPADLPSVDQLASAFAAAEPSATPPAITPAIDELMAPPEPVAPVAIRPLTVLEGQEWEFANGARVMFVPSDLADGTVEVGARSLGGWSQLEQGSRALAPRAVEAVLGSGLGDLSKLQINRFLDRTSVSVDGFIGETVEGLGGHSGTKDIETLFQLLHLLVTVPRVDEVAFGEALDSAEIRTALAESNPDWQAWVAYNEARYGEVWHRPVATRAQLDALTAESLLDLYNQRFGGVDDMLVAVVGDVDTAEIERLASLYIGTLPAGDDDTFADRRPSWPDRVVRREVPVSDTTAVLHLYHETEISTVPANPVTGEVLDAVLDNRLFAAIREELGAAYVARVSIDQVVTPRPVIESEVLVSGDPDRFDEIYSAVLSILADLSANGPTADELAEAKAVVKADYSNVTNVSLLQVLVDRAYLDDADLLTPERALEELAKVSIESVTDLAADLYDQEGRIEIIRRPTG